MYIPQKRQISCGIAYMCNLKKNHKNETTIIIKQKLSHKWKKQTYIYKRGKGRRDKLGDWD